jgi:hypothetical protein
MTRKLQNVMAVFIWFKITGINVMDHLRNTSEMVYYYVPCLILCPAFALILINFRYKFDVALEAMTNIMGNKHSFCFIKVFRNKGIDRLVPFPFKTGDRRVHIVETLVPVYQTTRCYSRITYTKSLSFCLTTFSASLTNLTVPLPQSRDCSCYVSRRILAPPLL